MLRIQKKIALILLFLLLTSTTSYANPLFKLPLTIHQQFVTANGKPFDPSHTVEYVLTALDPDSPLPDGCTGEYRFYASGSGSKHTAPITFSGAGVFSYQLKAAPHSTFPYDWIEHTYHITVYLKNDASCILVLEDENRVKVSALSWSYQRKERFDSDSSDSSGSSVPTAVGPANPPHIDVHADSDQPPNMLEVLPDSDTALNKYLVRTGDDSDLWGLLKINVCSLSGLFLLLCLKRKNRNKT